MALSMSSIEPTPSSYARMASSRYGTSRRLTMKPELSLHATGCLPSDLANSKAKSNAASEVRIDAGVGDGYSRRDIRQLHNHDDGGGGLYSGDDIGGLRRCEQERDIDADAGGAFIGISVPELHH